MASLYVVDDYIDDGYVQSGIYIDWLTKTIVVPREEMVLVQQFPIEIRELEVNTFRLALKSIEDSDEGIAFSATHSNNSPVLLGGIEYARVVEILDPYTITFEDGTYAVNIVGANSNIGDRVNVNNVSVRSANSAGLVQTREIQQSSYNNQVTIDTSKTETGTAYPFGTNQKPVNNLTDAKFIAEQRGLDEFFLPTNFTLNSGDNVTALRFEGNGATLNVARTTVTMIQGCITSNAQWTDCKITGYQGGESLYHNCMLDGIENAHCVYDQCGLLDGTARGYTIKQANVSSGHASYYKNCFSDEGTAIIDRNGTRMNVILDGFHGRIKFINQNHATQSGQVWIHLNGGTITVDSTCTKGRITVTGFGTLVNESLGTEVDASGFASEVAAQTKIDIEASRKTHQGFGGRWYVEPIGGSDLAPGTSPSSPLKTVNAAIAKAVSGRGDVIYLLAPGDGAANIDERIVMNKEDVHLRGPGRGIQFQPTTGDGDVITVDANNCSFSSFVVRAKAGSTLDNCIAINGKFALFEKLYLVGTETGDGSGFVFRGGDYHELIDCESEKMGRSGLKTIDAGLSSGSPREISVKGGNYYLNKKNGIELTSNEAALAGASTRIVRILGANVHDNTEYGISADTNSTRVVIDSESTIHSNGIEEIQNLSPSLQHFSDRELITQVKYRVESMRQTHQAFGAEFYVDPIHGNDDTIGTSDFNPFKTVVRAIAECQSGRGDVIYLLGPDAGTATINERIVMNKEDVHLRGPGRGVQFQPSAANVGPIIDVTANNCSMQGFIVRAPVGSLIDDGIVVSGKFSRMEKLYCVGPGKGVGTAVGIRYTGGDYHELWDMEVEKYGDSGVELDDQSDFHGNGSPREISVFGGNFYLNGEHGFCLHGKAGAAFGATSRIIRLLKGVNVHDNASYGVHSDPNVQGVVIDDTVLLHENNGGTANPQVLLEGTGYYKQDDNATHSATAVWNSLASEYNTVGSMGAKLNTASAGGVDYPTLASAVRTELTTELTHISTLQNGQGLDTTQSAMLLAMYQIMGLDPTKPLVVSQSARSAGTINQIIDTNSSRTILTRNP